MRWFLLVMLRRLLAAVRTLTHKPRQPALAGVLDDGRLPAECDPLELRDDPIERLAGEPAAAQGGSEICPVQQLHPCCRQGGRDAGFHEQAFHVFTPPPVHVGRAEIEAREGKAMPCRSLDSEQRNKKGHRRDPGEAVPAVERLGQHLADHTALGHGCEALLEPGFERRGYGLGANVAHVGTAQTAVRVSYGQLSQTALRGETDLSDVGSPNH
jgi:hypothetical protein